MSPSPSQRCPTLGRGCSESVTFVRHSVAGFGRKPRYRQESRRVEPGTGTVTTSDLSTLHISNWTSPRGRHRLPGVMYKYLKHWYSGILKHVARRPEHWYLTSSMMAPNVCSLVASFTKTITRFNLASVVNMEPLLFKS